ncbi:MAG: VacJ family lipoprotein [Proteobacteria bacterium]|nr:VacJ family lipoprotein [Pseudomonadota bacterium]
MAPAAAQTTTAPVSTQPAADATGASIRDPWEKFNRKVDKFNHAVDKVTMKPVMQVYKGVVPGVARDHISLAIANLAEPVTAINDLLQLHFGNLLKTVTRFGYNSTIGLGGLFDAAAAAGTPGHVADFGQTLGRWGVKPGPYVVLPFFGPSDLRDTLGLAVDNFGDPVALTYMHLTTTQGAVRVGLVITDLRVRLDPALQAAEEAADPYAFARAGYAQHRAALVRQARGEAEVLADYGADPAPADPAPATPPSADTPASATLAPVSSPAPASVEPPK